METVGHKAGFLLDRIRRRGRPRNRQQGNRSANPGPKKPAGSSREWSGRFDNEVGLCRRRCQLNRHTRLRRTAPPAPRRPDQRAICTPGCALHSHRQRSATKGRRHHQPRRSVPVWVSSGDDGDIAITEWPAIQRQAVPTASAAKREYCASGRRSHYPRSAISASDRPQPVQWPARASSAQASMHGDFGLPVIASSTRQPHNFCLWLKWVVSDRESGNRTFALWRRLGRERTIRNWAASAQFAKLSGKS